MSKTPYRELTGKFYGLYREKAYADALALVEKTLADFPEHRTEMTTWKICMQGRLGESEKAIETLRTAIDTSTYWYTPVALRGDPDLAALQGNPEFEGLVSLCEVRQTKALLESPQRLEFVPKANIGQKIPLLIAFHGRGHNAKIDAPNWQGLADQGWLVAVPRSSYQIGDGIYSWENMERAVNEVKAHYEALCHDFSIDQKKIVLGGFSQGGGVAIWSALTQGIPVCGVIGVGFYLDGIDIQASTLPAQPIPNIRIYMTSGAEESGRDRFAEMETLFADKGVPFHHEIIPGVGHEFPPNFDQILQRAIGFIFEK